MLRDRMLAAALFLLTTSIAAFGQSAAPVARTTLIKAGRVVDVVSGVYLANQGILIDSGRIKQIGAFDAVRSAAPKDAMVIDLSNAAVLPGLIDCHAHLLDGMDPALNGADQLILTITKYPPTKRVLLGAAMAREDLEAGFTTVRVTGHSGIDGDVSLRDAIGNRWIAGPRIVASARKIVPPGGQAIPVQEGVLEAILNQEYLVAGNPVEGRRAVLENLRIGADFIKVVVDEGDRVLDLDTVKAIVEEAHRVNHKVAAHATTRLGIQVALDAGVDSIEHADDATEEQFKGMREKGIFVDPTIWPRDLMVVAATTINRPPGARPDPEKVKDEIVAQQKTKLERAQRTGVKMVFGSDQWYAYADKTRGQATMLQLEALQASGMPPADAIRAATISAAELIGAKDFIGSLEVGKFADLIAVDGDPLASIKGLEKVKFVMKGGVIVRDERRVS